MANTQAFGALNDPRFSNGLLEGRSGMPQDADSALKQIALDIRAIKNEYVSPKLFKKIKGKELEPNRFSVPILSDGVEVCRVYLQVFTVDGLLNIFLRNSASDGEIPDLRVGSNPFPTIIPIPGIPTDIIVQNAGLVNVDYSIILSSAAG